VVAKLHAFAELRYPDAITKSGASITFSIEKNQTTIVNFRGGKMPEYTLCLQDIDDLIGAVFATTGYNPEIFGGAMLTPDAKEILMRHNRCSALDANQA
jgi:hypothetical protein